MAKYVHVVFTRKMYRRVKSFTWSFQNIISKFNSRTSRFTAIKKKYWSLAITYEQPWRIWKKIGASKIKIQWIRYAFYPIKGIRKQIKGDTNGCLATL